MVNVSCTNKYNLLFKLLIAMIDALVLACEEEGGGYSQSININLTGSYKLFGEPLTYIQVNKNLIMLIFSSILNRFIRMAL